MDVKNFDVVQMERRLRSEAEHAKDLVRDELASCLRDIGIAARAFAELPERSMDLMERSTAVIVNHVEIPHDDIQALEAVSLEVHGYRFPLLTSPAGAKPLPKGKYRVVVAFMPLVDK